ncbi:hypothetical protein COZ73_03880 [Candidatus Falkowbacteria bacterium CG_4_8_14_3_um_filter_36_11]|nr:MAG: hypothetical protein COZ73_03880 [Candidatus Falkowbacteria bacterium CG_4_8_14_3_um_filter_36_11]
MSTQKGKFIVIDGTDGSGKATQAEILVARLKSMNLPVAMIDFPQYGHKSAGLVEEYLNGKYGSAKEVGYYRTSIFYAADRYDASFKIRKWLEEGKIAIANRYVTANMAHQGGKIADKQERKKFYNWLFNLEYRLFAVPRPDLNIILHVNADIAQKLVDKKGYRDYINGDKRDLHEADLSHLRDAEKTYLEIAEIFPDISLIKCVKYGQIMAREEINNLIWEKIAGLIGFKTNNLPPNFPNNFLNNSKIENNNNIRRLKVQRLIAAAKLPTRAYDNDAGFDLYATDFYSLSPGGKAIIKTGLKMAIPSGYAGLIWDKGGIAKEGIHSMAGVIDSGFRGEITVNIINLSKNIYHILPGQKIAQIIIQKIETPIIVEEKIDDLTDRGEERFDSSGMF